MEVELSPERAAFVREMIASGRYRDEYEVISAALAILDERDKAGLPRLTPKPDE